MILAVVVPVTNCRTQVRRGLIYHDLSAANHASQLPSYTFAVRILCLGFAVRNL